ncbi:thiamine pyrophosphate-dependent enzyme [Sorangium sp. So ce1128]
MQTVASAIAQTLRDLHVNVVTHVPGFGATQIFRAYCELRGEPLPISYHEEVAYTVAHGASLMGARAATVIKSHGLAKAMNSVYGSLSTGVTAGLLVVVVQDRTGGHSDNIIDILPLLAAAGVPNRRVNVEAVHRDVLAAYAESERLQLPYALVLDAADSALPVEPCRCDAPPPRLSYRRRAAQHITCPIYAEYQDRVLRAKQRGDDYQAIAEPALPTLPAGLPDAMRNAVAPYTPVVEAFCEVRGEVVTGDASSSVFFSLPPFHAVDVMTYMGGSIPLAIGAHLAGKQDVWALTGDFSFVAGGSLGLVEAAARRAPIKVLVFANGAAAATGGQELASGTMDYVLEGCRPGVLHLADPFDRGEAARTLRLASRMPGLCIVVADYRTTAALRHAPLQWRADALPSAAPPHHYGGQPA